MPTVTIKAFGGIAPKTPPRYLQDEQAQVAMNCPTFKGSLRPLRDPGPTVHTLTKTGYPKTIYRFGQDMVSDNQYWFHWDKDVDVCRGQISGDTAEWTFYTGDGFPKATYAAIATGGTALPMNSRRLGIPAPTSAPSATTTGSSTGPETSPAHITLSPSVLSYLDTNTLWLSTKPDLSEVFVIISGTSSSPAATANAINSSPVSVTASVTPNGSVSIKTTATGANAIVHARYLVPGRTEPTIISSTGTTVEHVPVLESRVYAFTWVSEEAGLAMESAPSPATDVATVELDSNQGVRLSSFGPPPGGQYNVTAKRIYRSVRGVYLFVDEIPAATASYTDNKDAEELGEEMPSLYWAMPHEDLHGLINLPNGMMAGFVGRDVYFCEPYRPYAWPEPYMQSVDYPVVGFGRMDTTLAVLTTGVPYFMQGSHPDSVAVVKSDMEQACVSKRSIVSTGGSVIYASPDGLIALTPSGSRNLTKDLFDYKTWQNYFVPESLHAYGHDNQYIAFYDNGTERGGFIMDLASLQFTLHDIYTSTGFQDLQRDKLFLANEDKTLHVWDSGGTKHYIWRSKVFTMPEPIGFSCAQLEAEVYPMVMRVFADGVLKLEKTVQDRWPFRLPAGVARDWEVEIEGDYEVFSAHLSTSMTELAGV